MKSLKEIIISLTLSSLIHSQGSACEIKNEAIISDYFTDKFMANRLKELGYEPKDSDRPDFTPTSLYRPTSLYKLMRFCESMDLEDNAIPNLEKTNTGHEGAEVHAPKIPAVNSSKVDQ